MADPMLARNRTFYDSLWKRARLRESRWFPTHEAVEGITAGRGPLLEVGPGARPRFPIARACFADISPVAARKLREKGARVSLASAEALPFRDASFDAACAVDVVEHAADPQAALRDVARVLRPGGRLLLAVPIHEHCWTEFDTIVGHQSRFEPVALGSLLEKFGLTVERSAGFGILPRSRLLLRIAAWALAHFRAPAAWFEDRLVLPVAKCLERPLRWAPGLRCAPEADGLILVCRKR